jgi:glycosyltransferase involved in cell wall biosynthesis
VYLPENVSLVVIGRGEEGALLESHARKIGVLSRVKFMGFIPQTQIPQFFSVCDIFVRPSRSEGFGNSFIEAMASRLPVIATPVGGIPDFIDDQETGFFCSPDNPKSIAEAVLKILENNALRERVVTQAYERVVSRYSWEHIAHDMKEKVFALIS